LTTPKRPRKTLDDLRAAHDPAVKIPAAVRKAFAAMIRDGDDWEYEIDFARRADMAGNQLPEARPAFAAHIVIVAGAHSKVPRRVWFADAKIAAKLCKEQPRAFKHWAPDED